jgi:antitoxin component YwqK of YwqJK toxin-antitoxin module
MSRVNSHDLEFTNDYLYLLDGHPFTGIGVEYSERGNVLSEIEFRSGMQHGKSCSFFPSGKLRREAHYENNTLHGTVREWDSSGGLVCEEVYERGICIRKSALDSSGSLTTYYEISEADPQFEILQLVRAAKFKTL